MKVVPVVVYWLQKIFPNTRSQNNENLPKLSIVSSCSNFELNIVSQTRLVLSVSHGGGCDGFLSASDTKTFKKTENLSW